MEGALASQGEVLRSHEDVVLDLEARLSAAVAENQRLMDQYIEAQNQSAELEAELKSVRQQLEDLQRIILDLGRQNQALQVCFICHLLGNPSHIGSIQSCTSSLLLTVDL